MSELRLTPTSNFEAGGLIIFSLDLFVDGNKKESWLVNSGQPHRQTLMAYANPKSYSGDMRPIPEGVYNVGPLEFKGGKFDWVGSWGPGLGDFWARISYAKGETTRSAFGFHWDENRGSSPGSAGCVVFATKADVESFVVAMRKYDPPQLIVDYGFGTVPSSAAKPTPAPKATTKKSLEIVAHSGKLRANLGGEWFDLDSLKISADYQ